MNMRVLLLSGAATLLLSPAHAQEPSREPEAPKVICEGLDSLGRVVRVTVYPRRAGEPAREPPGVHEPRLHWTAHFGSGEAGAYEAKER